MPDKTLLKNAQTYIPVKDRFNKFLEPLMLAMTSKIPVRRYGTKDLANFKMK